jgi:hypothetical protein
VSGVAPRRLFIRIKKAVARCVSFLGFFSQPLRYIYRSIYIYPTGGAKLHRAIPYIHTPTYLLVALAHIV